MVAASPRQCLAASTAGSTRVSRHVRIKPAAGPHAKVSLPCGRPVPLASRIQRNPQPKNPPRKNAAQSPTGFRAGSFPRGPSNESSYPDWM
jgi:hypothetical protein